MVDEVAAVTDVVLTAKVAVVEPAATVTEAGTVALELLEASVTTDPPVGAATCKVTVPVLAAPPATEVGERVTEATPFSIWACKPLKIIGPQPESVSHPGPALDTTPFGSVPLVPEVIS